MNADKKKSEIKRLYDSAFPADREWNKWFFERVYKDDEALFVEDNDRIVSSLCLHRYDFAFQGSIVPFAYVSGAVTEYKSRNKGFMHALLNDAIRTAYNRGDAFIGLIPANRRLFFFYDKFQFATVVFADIERYTSLHVFAITEGYNIVEPTYEAFARLVGQRDSTVVYSAEDFDNIMYDIRHDGGAVTQVNDIEGNPVAMAFATENEDEIHVKELLGDDEKALEMALCSIKDKMAASHPMAVWRLPSGRKAMLRSRGMIRIVNVRTVLSALAEADKNLKMNIRVADPIIEENNGLFSIFNGNCTYRPFNEAEEGKNMRVDLDVTIDVLTKILFSGESIGKIFNLRTSHPAMSLMLD